VTARILQLLPGLTDVNGDAQNALVLAQRLRWAGVDAEVAVFSAGDAVPEEAPAVVVLGSGVDSTLPRVREALEPLRETLEAWIDAGVPVLAVGTGMELLGRSIPLPGGALPGLGIVPGEATPIPARSTSDLVVAYAVGRLTGYENHARGFVLASPAEPLGRVLTGTGNGEGAEGVRWKSVWGTHLHGPVLARNPALADAILAAAGFAPDSGGTTARVDELAQRVASKLEAARS
jgi:CobQ-like glutamine amidotransferase family enzyme